MGGGGQEPGSPGGTAAVPRIDGLGADRRRQLTRGDRASPVRSGHTAAPAIVPSVKFCANCRAKLTAFIRKPQHGGPDDQIARALVTACIMCSAAILGPAAAAHARTPASGYSVHHPLTAIAPAQMPGRPSLATTSRRTPTGPSRPAPARP